MKLKISMKLDNAAFDAGDDPKVRSGYEVASILRKLADRVEAGEVSEGNYHTLRDTNGNTVGCAEVTDE